mgnify:FL=1
MPKINVLEPKVFNQIAAGEVVERPASIVKELVENSIDAGASRISVEIFDGGISKILISDNGCGIAADDMELAFLPHATSKISDITDIFDLSTLGFRGEALASIASVTRIEVTSKTTEGKGHTIKLEGGKILATGEKGSPIGAYFCVQDLFFNTPARQKFLKQPKKEESEITSLMTRLILANPNIAFRYTADGREILSSTGRGIEEAICAIYGTKILENLVPIDYVDGDYSIKGYIGKTSFFKSNRTYQTTIINGRWVADSMVSIAISQSYESYMMKHCFPFCVIYFDLPKDQLDVNVHPNKLEVRFQDSKKVFGFVYHAISTSLLDDLSKKTRQEVELPYSRPVLFNDPAKLSSTPNEVTSSNPAETANFGTISANPSQSQQTQELNLDFILENASKDASNNSANLTLSSSSDSVLGEIILDKLTQSEPKYEFDLENSQKIEPKPIQTQLVADEIEDKKAYLETKIVGKIFNTFIIAEMGDNLYFIDQHAAHERLLFDKYVRYVKTKEMTCQPLLVPYTINVNHKEAEFITENLELLQQLGFEIDPFGDLAFKISAIPSILPDLNVNAFFDSFLSNINSIVQMKQIDLVLDNLAETACKHAVKGGDDLDREEIIKLVSDFAGGDVTLQCPHGRPFVVKFTRRDLDKWFKRTV